MVVTEPIAAMVVSLAILGEKLSSHSVSTALSLIGVGVMVVGVLGLAKGAAVRIEETRPGLPRPVRQLIRFDQPAERRIRGCVRTNLDGKYDARRVSGGRRGHQAAAVGHGSAGGEQRRPRSARSRPRSGGALTNQPIPNRSWHMPNVAPQGAGANGICTVPPSDNRSQ